MFCRGSTVCFVGEWHGDTGDAAFAHQLQSDFALKQRIALPNWSDTAHELTVWQRRESGILPWNRVPVTGLDRWAPWHGMVWFWLSWPHNHGFPFPAVRSKDCRRLGCSCFAYVPVMPAS